MRKLLLADDSVTIQRVIELTFSGEDIQVVAVNDGEQAISRIPAEQPDVVLADIGMPRKGGYDVAAFVKGRPDLSHIPVLLLAGAFEPVDQTRAEQVGADGVLIKPFEPRQVIERVKELLALVRPTISAEVVPEPAPARIAPVAAEPVVPETQSLDDLFESLNQALTEPAATPPAAEPEPEPFTTVPASPPDAASVPTPVPLPALLECPEHQRAKPERLPSPDAKPLLAGSTPPLTPAWPAGEDWLTPTTRDESHTINGLDSFARDRVSLNGVSFDSAPFDRASSHGSSASTLDDYFDRLSAAFSHTRPASTPATLPERFEDFGAVPPAEPPAASHEWLSQPREARGLMAFEIGEATDNPILDAVSALMARTRSHTSSDAEPHAGDRPANGTVAAPGPARARETTRTPVPPADLADVITERVLARLVPELAENLRRLVQQEITRTRSV